MLLFLSPFPLSYCFFFNDTATTEIYTLSLHDALPISVLDAVVDHLDEVAGAVRSAVEITLLRGAPGLLAPRRAVDIAGPGSEAGEDRVEVLHDVGFAADHHAVAALEPPHAATRPHVHVVNTLRPQLLRAADIVDVVRIAAVDQDVTPLQRGEEIGDGLVHHRRGHHEPDRARLVELLHEIHERGRPDRLVLHQLLHRLRRHVEDHALVAAFDEPPHHVCAHTAESDHYELHR